MRMVPHFMLLALALVATPALAQYEPAGCLSGEEQQLLELVNQYRQENGKAPIAYSQTLTLVGQSHIENFRYAQQVSGDLQADPNCNLHSWYPVPAQSYTTCCYTADHAEAACMWDKPGEISGNAYGATGFEVAASGYVDVQAALDGWKQSFGHNDVILSQGFWESYAWNAMGVGVDQAEGWYFLWFAAQPDPAGAPEPCATSVVPLARGVIQAARVSPNPFNPATSVRFELSQGSAVSIAIHDLSGRLIRKLDLGNREPGSHSIRWDGRDDNGRTVASGVYVVELRAGADTWTSNMALLK